MMHALVQFAALVVAAAAPAVSHGSKPNIIVIVSDDAGYADFSLQGGKHFPTPHIDSIAANGARFTNGYVSAPVCSPSRAGLITGRYQQRFGHELNILTADPNIGLPLSEKTLADAMKAAGYRTIAVGKWHLGSGPQFHPLERGFDDFYGFLSGGRSYFPNGGQAGKRMLRNHEPITEQFKYTTDEFGRQAAEYIRQNKDRPFFMYLAFNAVHAPHQALPSDIKKSQGKRKNLIAVTIALDRAVGTVLNELKQQGIFENTLVVFVNDNGGPKLDGKKNDDGNNGPLRGFKGSTWEGGIRVPFVVQWPARIPQGKLFDQPVIALDIMPTAMAAAGIAVPPGQPLDGVNLLPYLTGENAASPHEALCWRFGSQWAVRQGDWKLVNDGGPRLFNLAKDIGEAHDLSRQEPDKLKQLQSAYSQWNARNVPPKWQDGKHR